MDLRLAGNNIKELRKEKGLTQRQLATLVNLKQANISRWESGKIVPNVLDCWKLADFFDVTLDYLIGRDYYYKSPL